MSCFIGQFTTGNLIQGLFECHPQQLRWPPRYCDQRMAKTRLQQSQFVPPLQVNQQGDPHSMTT